MQETAQRLDPLFELVEPFAVRQERVAESPVFRLVPAGAQADLESSPTQVVDRHDRFREKADIPELHGEDHAPEADALRVASDRREERHGLEVWDTVRRACIEMVPDGKPVETMLVGEPPQPAELVDRRVLWADMDPEPHGSSPSLRDRCPPVLQPSEA